MYLYLLFSFLRDLPNNQIKMNQASFLILNRSFSFYQAKRFLCLPSFWFYFQILNSLNFWGHFLVNELDSPKLCTFLIFSFFQLILKEFLKWRDVVKDQANLISIWDFYIKDLLRSFWILETCYLCIWQDLSR